MAGKRAKVPHSLLLYQQTDSAVTGLFLKLKTFSNAESEREKQKLQTGAIQNDKA